MTIGRPRIFTTEERLTHKRESHERWKHANWDKYMEQKRVLARLQYRKRKSQKAQDSDADVDHNGRPI